MLGTMQDWPLLVSRLIDHAAIAHGDQEIVSARAEGDIHRTCWREVQTRSRQLAQALDRLGVSPGDRVGTLAWNGYRHLEAWFAVSGMGAVIHTINPRLFAEQISWIANHAEDRILLFDLSFLDLVERLVPDLHSVAKFVLMTDRASMPSSSIIPNLLCYEDLLEAEDGDFAWAEVEESAPAGLCYTSGTTGDPKGVLYSHRSTVLHTWAICMGDALDIRSTGTVMPVVPMFHANAWGIPYGAAMAGAKLVLNGPRADAAGLHSLIVDEGVTMTAAVPTVWLGLLEHIDRTGGSLGALKSVVIGGSAAPRSMIEAFEERLGVAVMHLWGMTELSPVGSIGSMHSGAMKLDASERLEIKCKQGRSVFGVEMSIVDDTGQPIAHDGVVSGHLRVRGPWVVDTYFQAGQSACDADGWFGTGDIATIDPLGYMQITDRAKDVIKSGGEWISSIALENEALAHPAIAEAAVIGMPHPKWDERPLMFAVPKAGASLDAASVLEFLSGRVAKWWLPDEIRIVSELPHTATGKLNKRALREQYTPEAPDS